MKNLWPEHWRTVEWRVLEDWGGEVAIFESQFCIRGWDHELVVDWTPGRKMNPMILAHFIDTIMKRDDEVLEWV